MVTAVLLLLASPPTNGIPDGSTSEVILIQKGRESHSKIGRAISAMSGKNYAGFLGFGPRLCIVPDQPEVIVVTPRISISKPIPIAPVAEAGFETVPAFSTDGLDVASLPGGDYLPEADTVGTASLLNHDVVVVQKTDPEYPLVARQARKEGEVTLRVCVGSNGQLKPFDVETVRRHKRVVQQVRYVVLHEEPAGYFFAESLVKVLPSWLFIPKIENGLAIEAQLNVRYRFVLRTSGASLTDGGRKECP
jgi:hypothetical protein